ncbi:CPBP family intramembrane glutamic endopeptidase [Streptomonospora wellingtoniae]|uniref:Type II CAAX endopeptidase family protein n=1 Tax=Streptomonospora wellingtoniae TaxID=3075544 RepID=A0ABU2KND5_9ACTN|nr:type II CAAX endopeptidase family protein [Streptomonospora sp. DSM 45055]MDT0300668.1 type II CAAX endopeptidase family protein [Streptomonospora sp. DSM 45055]
MPDTPHPDRMPAWRRFVKGRPMASFFTLAISLSWIAWTPYILSGHGLGLADFEIPGLWSQLLLMLPGAYLGPIFSAFLVTAAADGREGLRVWAGRLLKWRINWRWYALSLLGVPAALVLCGLPFAGGDVQLPPLVVLAAYIPGLVLQFLTTGIAEEPGWRDFALPRMQPYFGPLLGTLVLGVIWGIWHLPLFLTEWGGFPDTTWVQPVEFVASCVAISVVMTWVFNRTGESLPIAILLHASVNNFMSIVLASLFPSMDASHAAAFHIVLLAFGLAACALIVGTRGRLGYAPAAAAASRASGSASEEGRGSRAGVPS